MAYDMLIPLSSLFEIDFKLFEAFNSAISGSSTVDRADVIANGANNSGYAIPVARPNSSVANSMLRPDWTILLGSIIAVKVVASDVNNLIKVIGVLLCINSLVLYGLVSLLPFEKYITTINIKHKISAVVNVIANISDLLTESMTPDTSKKTIITFSISSTNSVIEYIK